MEAMAAVNPVLEKFHFTSGGKAFGRSRRLDSRCQPTGVRPK
jgi:hypothetical protein